ncbi:PREDICTED: uncharacterized protein LOC105569310 [Vollenhovia emeryi]|uniref:uncharacterized protein LOC105569310 n=1 Tax=Vollenhovia emeryi TaxID=411798 RepID=UPI0005F55AC5|nr:PREDICTED: uncharacterized protein LOC105569310 [Vollenhovia emeryi]
MFMIICKHKKYRQYLRKLDLMDDTLEELGIPKECHKIRSLTNQTLIIWFLLICTTWISDSLLYIVMHNDTMAIFVPCLLNYPVYVNSLMDINFLLLLRHIGARLDKINNHIKQLSETEEYGLRCKWKKAFVVNGYYVRNTKNRKHILWTVIHLHLELCRTARDISDLFGIPMALQMISYFVLLNGMFYFQYCAIIHLQEMYKNNLAVNICLSTNIWFIIFLMKLLSVNHICENVSTKVKKTRSITHKLTNLICFVEIQEEIYQFVLQISLHQLKFSAWGLFYFGYSFIRKFFVWTLTTLMFMAQMGYTPAWIKIYSRDNITYYNK